MKPLTLVILLFTLSTCLFAQDRPVFLPEDIESSNLEIRCLCKPGVPNKSRGRGLDISFLQSIKSTVKEEEGFPLRVPSSELRLRQFSIKLRAPVINKEGLKLLFGVIYRPENYDFDRIGVDYQSIFKNMDDRTLKSTGFSSILSKSWNERLYSHFRLRILFNGDYSGFINTDSRYAIYNFSGLLGVKKQDHYEWGVGINFTHSFRNTIALPFFLYNHTFNDKWGIEFVLPAIIVGRFNVSENSVMFLGLRYNSRSYSIEVDETAPQIFNLNHSEARAAFTLEQRVHPWIWLDLTAGVQYNFSTDFDAKDNPAASFQVEPGTSPYFKFGVFLSPPDSFLK